jgi:rhodanese-related sulfurtransferase
VARTLQKAGFKNVKALLGGWYAWEHAGYPTEPK